MVPRYWERPFDKRRSYEQGVQIAREFCRVNSLQYPLFTLVDGSSMPFAAQFVKTRAGSYSPATSSIRTYLHVCEYPQLGRSWPGWMHDCTPCGVVAHELGHHWHWHRGVTDIAKAVPRGEDAVSNYAKTNVFEHIAEAFQLFVLNPTLLLEFWPKQYEFFRSRVDTVVTAHYTEILSDVPKQAFNQLTRRAETCCR